VGHLDKAVDISKIGQRNLWVIYGRSTTGKTHLLSTFPKPILYLSVGDDGSNTINNVEGVKAITITGPEHLKECLREATTSTKYATIAVDTFSMMVNLWIDLNAIQKKKKMTQPMYGELKADVEEIIKLAHIVAKDKTVVLTCHEIADSFEGMEDEIAPDIRPNMNPGSRTYLEGMANYGIHTTVIKKTKVVEGIEKQVKVHAIHLDSSPYYWVKTQKPAAIKLPELVLNPSYNKIMKLLTGEGGK